MLEKEIKMTEVLETYQNLKPNKAPGLNGLLWVLSYTNWAFYQLANYILTSELLPASWELSSLILIQKENRDITSTLSYCPIALTNPNTKLFSANMGKQLIDNSQLCSHRPNRFYTHQEH